MPLLSRLFISYVKRKKEKSMKSRLKRTVGELMSSFRRERDPNLPEQD